MMPHCTFDAGASKDRVPGMHLSLDGIVNYTNG
jgi:hypothetical protein